MALKKKLLSRLHREEERREKVGKWGVNRIPNNLRVTI